MTVRDKLRRLEEELRPLERVVVAWSGGVDSSLLARVAKDTLGPAAVLAATAVSPSLPASELAECRELAAAWGLRWTVVQTDEMDRPEYRANTRDRCAHCKESLLDALGPLAAEEGSVVVLGVIVDDLSDDRPGQVVASSRGATFPLADAGLTKADVRALSRELGLPTWDKPAAACLASRIPHGTEVTVALLGRVERAEEALRQLGFGASGPLRVRHHGDAARVEFDPAELQRANQSSAAVSAAVRLAAGYREVVIDANGYRAKGVPVEKL